MKKIEIEQQCASCKGTGLYVGFAEKDGSAVVCHSCDGTGKFLFTHSYKDFTGKKIPTKPIDHVLQTNPGIGIGNSYAYKLTDFGGMPYKDWADGKPFPKGSEMRLFSCPAWWYQSVDYSKKPKWDECIGVGAFSQCECFKSKSECWKEWDKENLNKK